MDQLTVRIGIRPWSLNAERRSHRFARADLVKDTRWAAFCSARLSMADNEVPDERPLFDKVSIVVQPWAKDRRYRQDIANCFPCAKACIDGLVDAEVIADDDDSHLVSLTFAPHKYGRDELEILVRRT